MDNYDRIKSINELQVAKGRLAHMVVNHQV